MKKLVLLQLIIFNIISSSVCFAAGENGKNPFVCFYDKIIYERTIASIERKRLEEERQKAEAEGRRIQLELAKRQAERKIIEEKERVEAIQQEAQDQDQMQRAMDDSVMGIDPLQQGGQIVMDTVVDQFVELPEFSIQGIIWNIEKPSVIIGNRVYFIGDKLAGEIEVVNIDGEGVELLYNGKTFVKTIPVVLEQEEDIDEYNEYGSGDYGNNNYDGYRDDYGSSAGPTIEQNDYVQMQVI